MGRAAGRGSEAIPDGVDLALVGLRGLSVLTVCVDRGAADRSATREDDCVHEVVVRGPARGWWRRRRWRRWRGRWRWGRWRWRRRRRRRADRPGDAEDLIRGLRIVETRRSPLPGGAAETMPAAWVLPGRTEARLSRSVGPEPLTCGSEVLVGLDREPVGPGQEADRRIERDDEARAAGEGLVQALLEQCAGQIPGAVRVHAHVHRACRPRPLIDALDLDPGHNPARARWNREVVGELRVEGVQSAFEILRSGGDRAGVVVLVVENVVRRCAGRCAERERGGCRDCEQVSTAHLPHVSAFIQRAGVEVQGLA